MRSGQQGTTLVEVAAVLALVGIGIGLTAYFTTPRSTALQLGLERTEAALQQARLQSMAAGNAHRVRAADSSNLVTERANDCDAASWSAEPALGAAMPSGVSVATGWSVCFGARGIADDNVTVTLDDGVLPARSVEVMLGGTTRVTP